MLNQIEEFIRGLEFNQNTDRMLNEVKLFLDFTANVNLSNAQKHVRDNPEYLVYWTYLIEDLTIQRKENVLNASRIQVMLLMKYFCLNNQDFSANQDYQDDFKLIFFFLQRKLRETEYENTNNELVFCKKLFSELKQYKNPEIVAMQIIIELESQQDLISVDELIQYQKLLKESLTTDIPILLLRQCLLLLLRYYQKIKKLPDYNLIIDLREIGFKCQMQDIVSHSCHILLQAYYNDEKYNKFIQEYENSQKHLNKDTYLYYIICKVKQSLCYNENFNEDANYAQMENKCQQIINEQNKLDYTLQELNQILKSLISKSDNENDQIWSSIGQIIFLQEWIYTKSSQIRKQNIPMVEQIIALLEFAFQQMDTITKQYGDNMNQNLQKALQQALNLIVDIISDQQYYQLLVNDEIMMALFKIIQQQVVDQEIKKILIRVFKLLEIDDFIKKQETRTLLLCLAIQYDLKRYYNCEIFKEIIKKPFTINFPISYMLFIEQLKIETKPEYEKALGKQLFNMLLFTYQNRAQDKVCFYQLLTLAVQKEQEFTNNIIIKFLTLPQIDYDIDIVATIQPIFQKLNNQEDIELVFKKVHHFLEDYREDNQMISAYIYNVSSQFSDTDLIGYYQSLCALLGYLQHHQIYARNIEQIYQFYQSNYQSQTDDEIVLTLLNDIGQCMNNLNVEFNILFDTILYILDLNNIGQDIKENFYHNLLEKAIEFQQGLIVKLLRSCQKETLMFEQIFYLIREQQYDFKETAYAYLQSEKLTVPNKVVVLSYLSEVSDEDDTPVFLDLLIQCLDQIVEKKPILPYLQIIYLRVKILIQEIQQCNLEKGNYAITLLERIV